MTVQSTPQQAPTPFQPAPNVYDAEPIPAAAREEIERLLTSGDLFRYTAPENAPVSLLEREFAAMMGAKFALAVSSCSAALFLSLKALGLPRDARVLIPGFTFAAVPSSIVHADCIPVLCEVGENYRIDIADFAARLDDDISAVIISHMRGHTSDMDAIMALCDARDIPVIEDAAHSLGTEWHGQKIGTIGEARTLGYAAAGFGGMLTLFVRAVMCNWMVSTGVVAAMMSNSVSGKIMAMWMPILVFFYLGFEHSIVNMFLFPSGIMLGGNFTWFDYFAYNEIPTVLGNLVGGLTFVGGMLYMTHFKESPKRNASIDRNSDVTAIAAE